MTARPPADADPDFFLHERYCDSDRASGARRTYYTLKPLLPRPLQLALRRRFAPIQARRGFPAWPIEPILVDRQHEEVRRRLHKTVAGRYPFVNFWPDGKRFAAILTHDVEGPAGVTNVHRVREVERRHGFVSSWNFVAEWYPIPDGLLDELRAEGCEIGLHGIRHDGKLFRDRASFEAALPAIGSYLAAWGAVGFRSPATHRKAEWMGELPVLYDSSFPDTDPFEPKAGGCCSIFPFRFGDVVELPITLAQDHTLWQILREPGIARWLQKSDWIMRNHGLINVIVHPDYVVDPGRLELYAEFLAFLRRRNDGWHALPRDVARWWRQRERLQIVSTPDGRPEVCGTSDHRASVAYAREEHGVVVFETGSA